MPLRHLLAVLLLALCALPALAQSVYKCQHAGAVTYQSTPCPGGEAPRRPTVAELNAQRKLQMQASASAAPVSAPPAAPVAGPGPVARPAPAAAQAAGFRCDGRTRCSQMSSCAEARFFLARCPGVEMDGDHDGVPCEMQWCQ
jgi:hypothetical protein